MEYLRNLALELYKKPYNELSLEQRQRLFEVVDDAIMYPFIKS